MLHLNVPVTIERETGYTYFQPTKKEIKVADKLPT